MIVYISIGNSDDKLSQREWAKFYTAVATNTRTWATAVHGQWVSEPASAWQNACWCIDITDEAAVELKGLLADFAGHFRQDSISWAKVQADTEFITPSTATSKST